MTRYVIGKKENGKFNIVMSKNCGLYPPFLDNHRKPFVFKTKQLAEIARDRNFKKLKIFDVSELGYLTREELGYEIDEDYYIVIDSIEEWRKYF